MLKMLKFNKKTVLSVLWCYCVISLYFASKFYIEGITHIYPSSEKSDISFIAEKDSLNNEDYAFILNQTGLGKSAVNSLSSLSELEEYQQIYYSPIDFICKRNSPVSSEEYVPKPLLKFADIEDGDILITRSSHVFSWRNGHAAIVINAEEGRTVEAVVIGRNSSVQSLDKWEHYPNVTVLRLKNASSEERKSIAEAAENYLVGRPYNLIVGFLPRKYRSIEKQGSTQCAHLVWLAYASAGYDIDSDKGLIVTPKDIYESELLEVVQTYGMG